MMMPQTEVRLPGARQMPGFGFGSRLGDPGGGGTVKRKPAKKAAAKKKPAKKK